MLSFFRLLLLIVVLAAGLLVGLQNVNVRVDHVRLEPFWHFRDVQLLVVVFASYCGGLITLGVVYLVQQIKLRSQISRLRKDNRRLSDELHQLRNLGLDEIPREVDAASREVLPGN